MTILTPARLAQLSSFPLLKNSWYFIAAATLSVCNQPKDVSLLVHYALREKQNELGGHDSDPVKSFEYAQSRINLIKRLNIEGDQSTIAKTKVENLYNIHEETNFKSQFNIAQLSRESVLKSIALGGIPKAINTLMYLKTTTPTELHELKTKRNFDISNTQFIRNRGQDFWNQVYGKVSTRIINQMETAYPDLWQYAKNHIYSPLLSYNDILNAKETSFVIIACLVPQDVNPQLKGHLKGALNNGATEEEVEQVRQLAILVSEWSGIKWTEEVAKLKPKSKL
ncbi:hypothetical protein BN7_1798 [Wickerhamomyces ciferrii]|uniref:Carboxymuconolactone decarboxylase-like domain-containing protein n=1 Tax=Wickerhamomyces ciferrii (strain ATCC 14091 / BCRC 22168 / CBS 111 / JCM 3599 / NBRC 0793 / NRRL Y-1031 F-60-10) TaxID=1206466 RepID=K0KLN2_WICCF|nr:uncharacterized protein BN7_1798 [Wickerhamomyces ciferrii]CCH42254.1 hypothetical protein BN7_1798 [Wickerhamomyces ciferrii]